MTQSFTANPTALIWDPMTELRARLRHQYGAEKGDQRFYGLHGPTERDKAVWHALGDPHDQAKAP